METTEDQIQKALEVLRKAGLFSPLNGAINDVPVVGQFDSDGKMVATEITEERLEKAKQLLRDPRLIDRYKDLCGAAYVGREEELVLLRLALTSRLFPWALWVIVFGPSGVGKNALLKAALGTVWPEDAEAFTRISPQYLLYRDRPLDHRIITIYELAGAGEAMHILRTMRSEGRLRLGTVRGGGMEINKSAEGAVVLSTTTADIIDHELATRVIHIGLNHDPALARAVYQQKAAQVAGEPTISTELRGDHENGSPAHDDEEWRIFQIADHLIEPAEVIIPYATKLSENFPVDEERYMRVYDNMILLLQSSALLFQFQRPRDKQGRIVADRRDYEVVFPLRGVLGVSDTSPPEHILSFVDAIRRCRKESEPPTRGQVQEKLEVSLATIKRYVQTCRKHEWIEVQGKGRDQRLMLIEEPSAPSLLPAPDELFGEVK